MGDLKRFRASLIISSDKISAAAIQGIMGLDADEMIEKGAQLSGRPGSRPHPSSLWKMHDRVSEDESIDAHVEAIVELLEQKTAELELLAQTCAIEIWCFISFEDSQCGFVFQNKLLDRISRIPCDLVFDIYGGAYS